MTQKSLTEKIQGSTFLSGLEKGYWLNKLSAMNDTQKTKLENILDRSEAIPWEQTFDRILIPVMKKFFAQRAS